MVAHPRVKQAYPGNGGECWSLRCSHWSRAGTPWSVILSQWSHGGSPWRTKSSHWSPGGSIWSIRCSHWKEMWTHWLAVQDCWLAVKPPETSLRYPFKVTHGLDYFGPQRALAYRLDAISQGRKNSWFPVPNPLPSALIMHLHASKTLRTGLYM